MILISKTFRTKTLLAKSLVSVLFVLFSWSVSSSSCAQQHQQRNEIPAIGVAGGVTMSIERERIFGDFYMREIRNLAPLADDPVLREYLSEVGHNLVKHTDNVRYPFNFFIVRDDSINAFAFLGGYIGIHTGLILEADDESELASVLSHEIAHVTQRHIARNLERMEQASTFTMAQLLGSIAIAMVNPVAGMATLSASIAGLQQRQINYTRQFELEADRVGMDSLYRAGYDVEGAPRFFAKLASKFRYATQMPQMLVTHPLPESRIADTRSRAMQYPPRNLEPSLGFELAKVRIRARYSSREASDLLLDLKSEEKQLKHPHQLAANNYGKALALFRLARYEEALSYITPLRNNDLFNLFYLDTLTDIYLELGRGDEAVELLTNEFIRRPNNQVITLNLAYAANHIGDYELSRRVLTSFIIYNKNDMLAWNLLYESHQKNDRPADMHEALAEIFALRGNFRMAIEELHTAISKIPEERNLTRQRLQARILQFRNFEIERNRVG
ncbi:M48 family metalloprotease [Aliidiomarina quisquiliarum]|uniref:beta-barrel assembly-enhancing protease n=1 Tax=Aliidiomarina quisquiliarum TaxID=2938947 RepID=UPI00208EC32E|nr:M48 family metalloprotease [Aliidiomarina quisquiliarum]MCO4320482.1 M48 family metalloprotease [Aliidiomarina quisquiliarum]